jgi:hypothetical protein
MKVLRAKLLTPKNVKKGSKRRIPSRRRIPKQKKKLLTHPRNIVQRWK